MDKKSIAILVGCGLLLLAWGPIINKISPPPPKPVGSAVSTNTAAISAAPSEVKVAPAAASVVVTNFAAVAMASFDTNAPEQTLELVTADARYVFTSRGGGIRSVELLHYPEAVSALRQKKTAHAELIVLNEPAALPLGAWADSSDGIFTLTPFAGGVRAEKVLTDGVRVVKEFSPGSNYLVAVTVRLENTDAAARTLAAREFIIGTTAPLGARDNGQLIGVMWQGAEKLDETATSAWFANTSITKICELGTRVISYGSHVFVTHLSYRRRHQRRTAVGYVTRYRLLISSLRPCKISVSTICSTRNKRETRVYKRV